MIDINDVKSDYIWDSISEEIVPGEEIKEKWSLMSFNERLRYSTTEEKLIINEIDISSLLEFLVDKIVCELDLFETDFVEETISDENKEILKQAVEKMIKNYFYYMKDEQINPESELRGGKK